MPGREENRKESMAAKLSLKLAVGLFMALSLIFLGALLISSGTMPESSMSMFPVAACFAGALYTGFSAAKSVDSRAFMAGVGAGLAFFMLLFLLGAIFFFRWAPGESTLRMLLGSLTGGLLGGLLSASKKRRRGRK